MKALFLVIIDDADAAEAEMLELAISGTIVPYTTAFRVYNLNKSSDQDTAAAEFDKGGGA